MQSRLLKRRFLFLFLAPALIFLVMPALTGMTASAGVGIAQMSGPPDCTGMTPADCEALFRSVLNCADPDDFYFGYEEADGLVTAVLYANCDGGPPGGGEPGDGGPPDGGEPGDGGPPDCTGMTPADCEAMLRSVLNCADPDDFYFGYEESDGLVTMVLYANCDGGPPGGGEPGDGGGPVFGLCVDLTPAECEAEFEILANCDAQGLTFVFLYTDLGEGDYLVDFAGCVDEGGYVFNPPDCDGLTLNECVAEWIAFTGCAGLGLEFYFEFDEFEGGGYELTLVMCVAPAGMAAGPLARQAPLSAGMVEVQIAGVTVYISATTVSIWDPRNPNNVALNVTQEQIASVPANPSENTLIASSDDQYHNLYRLTTGELQVNSGPDFEGKTHVIVYDTDTMDVIRRYTIAADGTTN